MFNILILAILDLIHHKQRILRKVAMRHALTGSLAVLMITLALFFIVADLPYQISMGSFAVGLDSLTLIVTFVVGMRLVQGQSRSMATGPPQPEGIGGALWPGGRRSAGAHAQTRGREWRDRHDHRPGSDVRGRDTAGVCHLGSGAGDDDLGCADRRR
jgi:hypothetical protein